MDYFDQQEYLLMQILKDKLDSELYEYTKPELKQFYHKCYDEFDERAVHTDREGQPKLIKYNRYGEDISEIWVNEGYKKTVEDTYHTGIVGYVHKPIPQLGRKGNYLYSYAHGYLLSQVEPGFYCPVTLTMAVAYVIDEYADKNLKEKFLPHVLSTGDEELYEGATFLTERQGGSDVGANEVEAVKEGDHYRLFGEKYFASNSGQCGVAAVLARMKGSKSGTKGLSLFLIPWKQDDGSNNHIKVRRLKDKLGVRAVPSAEIELEGSKAYLVGEADKGFYYMMEALNLSRVCNATASTGIMKRALKEGYEYAGQRDAFGQKIINYSMVQETLANLQVRFEVQLSALFESIDLFDQVMRDRENRSTEEIAMNRLLIALMKAHTAKEAIDFSHEAIEMHGGNGYIEDFITPRLLRDAQVLTVWEGTDNILSLEVLRLMHKYRVHEIFISEMEQILSNIQVEDKYREKIAEYIKELTNMVLYIHDKDETVQTYHSRRIARYMTDIYLAVHALKRANDKREKRVAVLFMDWLFKIRGLDDEMIAVKHFEEIMNPQKRHVKV
ncbi:Acyl-CoA dehydrogenase [Salinibacillus kushneri]|uniref:Acyl-CoA dehydrogenase n=1 Tax=Salinibacillus kushneri TaxID=237682 RepID=A0A1I0CPM2_9BACI|nr:acyl-CoA dehydrogenase family protein [Salinibacillus kushneri]SET21601.1 Acyl-CoA dehydrogenase [Salinibacillus kushneri]